MIVVIVTDCFAIRSNGTAVSANNLYTTLKAKGHTVRVVAPMLDNIEGGFCVEERYIPLVTELAKKQHTHFGKADKKTLREAFSGADIIHFFLPFKLEIIGVQIAREMQIPYFAGFHLQPQNLTYNAHLSKIPFIHQFIFWLFHFRFYRYIRHIHCPSSLIKSEVENAGYGAKTFVISNGFTPRIKCLKRTKVDDFFHIAMTGRHSYEKRQDILIEAVKLSKYESRIKLHLNGLGPRTEHYKKLAKSLSNPANIGFISDEDLVKLYEHTDLYIHTSDVDGESISTLDAISNGIVPIISDSAFSATKQFALDSSSLFKAGSASDLAQKIDFFIENPDVLQSLGKEYAKVSKQFDLGLCVDKMIDLYNQVILDFKNGLNAKFDTF